VQPAGESTEEMRWDTSSAALIYIKKAEETPDKISKSRLIFQQLSLHRDAPDAQLGDQSESTQYTIQS
jgi:hypothetical protein